MSEDGRWFVWGLNGYVKALVYTRKYLPEDKSIDREAGYYDCIRIEEPKVKQQ
jgi:hypothetical protein